MVGPSATSSKLKGKQLALNSKESDVERSSGLKEILIEPERIHQRTQIKTWAIAPVDYNLMARGININVEHSAIAESQSSNSYVEKEAFVGPRLWLSYNLHTKYSISELKNKHVQVLNSYRDSKWLCGSWSTRRVCDRSVQGFLLKSLWRKTKVLLCFKLWKWKRVIG